MASRRWEFDGTEIAPGRVTLRRLGGGADYEVYLVWDDLLHAAAAAKVVRPDRLDDPVHARRLGREAVLLDRLAHPCLPRCFDRSLDAPVPHLLLEHLDGPPLSRVLERFGPVDLLQLLPIAVQVAGVLHFLAARGYVHLDVKPGNIVMSAVPRVIDLSLARSVDDAAALRSAVGTPGYLSPEQCRAAEGATVGSPADIWALGVTLHEAIAGERPFRSVAWDEVAPGEYPQVSEDPRPLGADVPAHVRDVVTACLARDPDDRPTAADVVARLEPVVADLPPQRLRRRLRPGRR